MKLFVSTDTKTNVKYSHLFLDNDFLGEIFKDKDVLQEFSNYFESNPILLDPITAFEFLRDVFLPSQREIREKFIAQPIFQPVLKHQEIFTKLEENALLLSKIYAHNNMSKGVSYVDLFLAARLMYNFFSSCLITGNKKHFPNFIFDTVGILNIEQVGDGTMRAFSIIRFNRDKFESCYYQFKDLEKRANKGNNNDIDDESSGGIN